MKLNRLTLLVIIAVLLLSACGNAEGGNKRKDISIGTSPLGSGWYNVSITIADIWMDTIDDVNVNVLEGGSIGNIRSINEGKDMLMGWGYTPDYLDALNSEGVFEEDDITDISALAVSYPVYLTMVTLEKSGIAKVEDFKDKRIHAGAQGTGSEIAFQRLLEAHDLSYDIIEKNGGRVSFGGYDDAATQLQDGIVDVAVGGGAPDIPNFKEVEAMNPMRVIPVEISVLEGLTDYGYRSDLSLPSKTYESQEEDLNALTYQSMIIVNSDMSEDEVYELTKSLWENIDIVKEDHPTRGEYFNPKEAVEGLDKSYFHPGAIKYYEEIEVM